MRLIDADALTLCTYDLENYHSFRAVPEETLNDAPTLVVGPNGDIVPEIELAKWVDASKELPKKSGSYFCAIKDECDDPECEWHTGVFYATCPYVKDDPSVKDGFYEIYVPEYGFLELDDPVLYWLSIPELPKEE